MTTRIVMDETSLKRANPRRGATFSMPTPAAGRKAVAQLEVPDRWWMDAAPRGAPAIAKAIRELIKAPTEVTDVEIAAGLLNMVIAQNPRGDSSLVEPVVVWLAASLGLPRLLEALTRAGFIETPGERGYHAMNRQAWLAAARVLCLAAPTDYEAARGDALALRKASKDHSLEAALAMIFPSEPWATRDAGAYKTNANDTASERASCLLHANTDFPTAERLAGMIFEPRGSYKGYSGALSGPAYALLDRFGERAEPLLSKAFDWSLAHGDDVACEWIGGALACIASPRVAALFEARLGKKVAGGLASSYFERHPELAPKKGEKGKNEKKEKRQREPHAMYAASGRFDLHGPHRSDTESLWREYQTNPAAFGDWPKKLARPPGGRVAGVFAKWSQFRQGDEWLTIEVSRIGVDVRGVLSAATVKEHGVEIASMFRLGDYEPVYFNGDLWVFSPDDGWGFRLSIRERGESSLEELDEAPAIADDVRALLGAPDR